MPGNCQRLAAMSLLYGSECAQQLHFNPHLTDIGSTFCPGKESIVEEADRTVKISRLRQVQDQLEDQRRGSGIQLRIFFQGFDPLWCRTVQQAECLVESQVDCDVIGIAAQPVLKCCKCAF